MLGSTINREGQREDIEMQNYYGHDRSVPSFDARYGRSTDLYNNYAPADSVNNRPNYYSAAPTPVQQRPTFQQPNAPTMNGNRDAELWQRLNNNTISRNSIESNMNFVPGQHAPFEPLKLRETQPRQQISRRTSKKMSTQGKVILAVYLAVVLLIVTLVIVNAELINTPEVEAEPGAAAISLYEPNESGLSFMATPYNNVEPQTNWFDKICDKLGD